MKVHRVRAYAGRRCECYHTFSESICARAALAYAVDEDCAGLARRQPVVLEDETGSADYVSYSAAVMPAGAFVASESPRAAKRATLPLVLPVRVQVALPTPAGYC